MLIDEFDRVGALILKNERKLNPDEIRQQLISLARECIGSNERVIVSRYVKSNFFCKNASLSIAVLAEELAASEEELEEKALLLHAAIHCYALIATSIEHAKNCAKTLCELSKTHRVDSEERASHPGNHKYNPVYCAVIFEALAPMEVSEKQANFYKSAAYYYAFVSSRKEEAKRCMQQYLQAKPFNSVEKLFNFGTHEPRTDNVLYQAIFFDALKNRALAIATYGDRDNELLSQLYYQSARFYALSQDREETKAALLPSIFTEHPAGIVRIFKKEQEQQTVPILLVAVMRELQKKYIMAARDYAQAKQVQGCKECLEKAFEADPNLIQQPLSSMDQHGQLFSELYCQIQAEQQQLAAWSVSSS